MGYAWIILGVLIVRNMLPKNGRPIASVGAKSSSMWAGLTDAFKARTTIVLICVLFISDSPCVAFNYMIIYLQYCGVSNHMAGVACAVTMVGAAIGGSLGGLLVSFIDGRCKHYGLISCANVVICIRLVACSYFFFGPEPRGGLRWFHFLELAIIGATSMTAGCIDRPIMAHVMKKEFQASSWSICRCIAGVLSSSIFYPLCGYLSETVFGYIPSTDSFETMDIVVRMGNASALRKSMASLFVGGTALNIACYVAFFFTYPQDKKNRMELDEKLKQVEEKEKRETGQTAAGSAAPATVVK
ncbi:major facilitator superfamily member protein [Babesia caballi]|uniref:Major facilitator superfamily member protein n=1 Tax=Babesia caballi TaxID=5871 RepID=A0AAV4LQU6_BABCB|nr:major facilitator superfamily member protein [Babesia caballi]